MTRHNTSVNLEPDQAAKWLEENQKRIDRAMNGPRKVFWFTSTVFLTGAVCTAVYLMGWQL